VYCPLERAWHISFSLYIEKFMCQASGKEGNQGRGFAFQSSATGVRRHSRS
jgi:hypothetical protein